MRHIFNNIIETYSLFLKVSFCQKVQALNISAKFRYWLLRQCVGCKKVEEKRQILSCSSLPFYYSHYYLPLWHLLLHKYASKQINLNWFTILVELGQYKIILQIYTAKKYYDIIPICKNSRSWSFSKIFEFFTHVFLLILKLFSYPKKWFNLAANALKERTISPLSKKHYYIL